MELELELVNEWTALDVDPLRNFREKIRKDSEKYARDGGLIPN